MENRFIGQPDPRRNLVVPLVRGLDRARAHYCIPENRLARQVTSTDFPYELVRVYLGLPDDVRGLAMLDIGAGGSSTTMRLLAEGADAYALDPRYTSRAGLKGDIKRIIDRAGKAGRKVSKLSPTSTKESEWDDILHPRIRMRRLDDLMASMGAHPDRYVAGHAGDLPFEDDKFDVAFSSRAISPHLAVNKDILLRALSEALRVVKSGGTIRIWPFWTVSEDIHPDVAQLIRENEELAIRFLDEHPLVGDFQLGIFEGDSNRLVVTKK